MPYQLIGSGDVYSIPNLPRYEEEIDERQRVKLVFNLRGTPPAHEVMLLESGLRIADITELKVQASSGSLIISWRKGNPLLIIIPLIILALAVIAAMIIGWQLYKEVIPEGAQPMAGWAITGLLVVGAIIAGKYVLGGKR